MIIRTRIGISIRTRSSMCNRNPFGLCIGMRIVISLSLRIRIRIRIRLRIRIRARICPSILVLV